MMQVMSDSTEKFLYQLFRVSAGHVVDVRILYGLHGLVVYVDGGLVVGEGGVVWAIGEGCEVGQTG